MPEITHADEHRDAELEVARVFCQWYSKEYGVRSSVKGKPRESAPDVLIHVGKSEVAMELAQYREQGSFNELFQRDYDLKSELSEQFIAAGPDRLPCCTPRLEYRKRAGYPGQYKFPKPNLWRQIGNELIELMRDHPNARRDAAVTLIRFKRGAEIAKNPRSRQRCFYAAAEQFSALSEHFDCVKFRWHPQDTIGRPTSSMNARYGRADLAVIERVIRTKLANLEDYRRKVPATPIWLLYYTDARMPTSRLIGKGQCVRV